MKDIAPELLEKLQEEYKKNFNVSKKIKDLNKKLLDKTVTHRESNELSIEIGNLLAKVFQENLSSDILPDGKMYYNIAERIIKPIMNQNYELISAYATETQKIMNNQAGLHIKGVKPKLNQDRINGIIERVSSEDDFDKIKWILDEPVRNFSQSIIDDTIKVNSEGHYKLGLKPKIVRRESGDCCEWCKQVEGVYEYPNVPKDVYRRHRYCRCTVEYYPGDGKIQNVHTKKWIDPDKDDKIEKRKTYNLQNTEIKTFNSGVEGGNYFTKSKGYDKWNKSITDDEKKSIVYYTSKGYKEINPYNRKIGDWAKDGKYGKYIKDAKEKLKNAGEEPIRKDGESIIAFKKRQKADPYYPYRAALKEEERILNFNSDLDNVISKFELKDNIMLMRGVSKEALPKFNNIQDLIGMTYSDPSYMSTAPAVPDVFQRGYTLKMNIPAGKGRGAYLEDFTFAKREHEFLLARNSKFKIKGVKIKGDETILEMEWIE